MSAPGAASSPSLSPTRRTGLPPLPGAEGAAGPDAANATPTPELTEGGSALLKQWAQIRQKPPALGENDLFLQVTDIYRYMVDSIFWKVTGLEKSGPWAFDMVLSDGVDKIKVVVNPELSKVILHGGLSKNDVIRIEAAERRFDDTKAKVPPFEILLGFQVVGRLDDVFRRGERKPSYPMHTPYFIRARKPLISSRGCYVSPNATDLPLSFRKRQEVVTRKSLLLELPGEDHPGIATTHPSLLELLNLHIGKKPRGAPFEARQAAIFPEQYYKGPGDGPPILARVVRKLGWGWYGKPSDEKEQFPCFFQLVVQDASYMGSEEVQVNIWNSLAVDLFLAIQLNDIIYIEDYKARTTKVGKEIMVNPGKYGSSLRIVDPKLHLRQWPDYFIDARLPPVPLRLVGSDRLKLLPDGTEVDHAGLLLHAGNLELERSGPLELLEREYRWCLVHDGFGVVAIKAYASGGPGAVKQRLVPGFHVLATCLTVISSPAVPTSKLTDRKLYLQGTLATQIYVFDPEDTAGLWFADAAEKLCVVRADRPTDYTVGGSVDPVSPFPSFTALVRSRPRYPQLTQLIDIEGILDSLTLHERRRIWVVCRVGAVVLPLRGGEGKRLEFLEGAVEQGAGVKRKAGEDEEVEQEQAIAEQVFEPEQLAEVVPETPVKQAQKVKKKKAEVRSPGIFGFLTRFFGGGGATTEADDEEEEEEDVEAAELDAAQDTENEGPLEAGTRAVPAGEAAAAPEFEAGPADLNEPVAQRAKRVRADVEEIIIDVPEEDAAQVEAAERLRRQAAQEPIGPVPFPAPHPAPKLVGAHLDSKISLLRSFPHIVEAPELPSDGDARTSLEVRADELNAELADLAVDPDRVDPISELVRELSGPEKEWYPACLELDPVNPAPIRIRAVVVPNCTSVTDAAKQMDDPTLFTRRTFASQLEACLGFGMRDAVAEFRDEEFAKTATDHWNGRTFLVALNLHRDGPGNGDVRCVVSEGYVIPTDEAASKLTIKDGDKTWIVGGEWDSQEQELAGNGEGQVDVDED